MLNVHINKPANTDRIRINLLVLYKGDIPTWINRPLTTAKLNKAIISIKIRIKEEVFNENGRSSTPYKASMIFSITKRINP